MVELVGSLRSVVVPAVSFFTTGETLFWIFFLLLMLVSSAVTIRVIVDGFSTGKIHAKFGAAYFRREDPTVFWSLMFLYGLYSVVCISNTVILTWGFLKK